MRKKAILKFDLERPFYKDKVLYAHVKKFHFDEKQLKRRILEVMAERTDRDFDELMEIDFEFLISFQYVENFRELKCTQFNIDYSSSDVFVMHRDHEEKRIIIAPRFFKCYKITEYEFSAI